MHKNIIYGVILNILFILFDMDNEDLHESKSSNLNLIEEAIILNFNVEYKLLGIIDYHSLSHYNAIAIIIIFNPSGCTIDQTLSDGFKYYHDSTSNNGNTMQLYPFENWKYIGILNIVI